MRIRNKFTVYMLLTAMLPLVAAMGLALWNSTNQTTKLTIEVTQGRLDTAAQKISSFFSSRIAEVSAYSQTSTLKSMKFPIIRPLLVSELKRHENIYEKFILGTPEGYFYNTSGGNPNVKGLRTSNDRDQNAKPKHIRKRDYWQQTVGKNITANHVSYVSDPMISYTTGAKQIVVASTILSNEGKVKGMIGGALPWSDINRRITQVSNEISQQLGREVKFFLISNTGTYWHHWDIEKIVHLKLSKDGNPFLNNIGEKEIIKYNIKDEKIPELVLAGSLMQKGENGHTVFIDPESNEKNYIVFSHIPSAKYSVGLIVPRNTIMAPVHNLQLLFIYIFLSAAFFVILIAFFVSKNISSPIVLLNKMAKQIHEGNWSISLKKQSADEIGELNESFSNMAIALEHRERLLKESEQRLENINVGLEERITQRTQELEITNENLLQQVDERVIAEIALKNKEQLLKNTGELAHVGGWKLDVVNNELFWTEEMFHIHNVSIKDDINIDKAINYFTEDSQSSFKLAIENAKNYGTSFDLELNLIPATNKNTWVRVICHTNKEGGKIVELLGAYQDITELKKVEKLKSEFVSTVSHELRTPLTAIHGSISVLNSEYLVKNDPETTKTMLDVAERNSRRLILLINDLLDMEKIESGKMDFTFSLNQLTPLIQQSITDNESYAKKYSVTIKIVTEIPDIQVNVDKGRFFQVMSNLISNAAKFSNKNGAIDISTEIKDKYVYISVQDYGDGIPDGFKDKIFSQFTQADSSNTRNPGGTGLGLSISKSIIEHMGGSIEYESKVGEGSRFYFTLPIV